MTETMKKLIALCMAYDVDFEYNETPHGKYLIARKNKDGLISSTLWEIDDPQPYNPDRCYVFFPWENNMTPLRNASIEEMMTIILRKERERKK